MRSLVFFNHAGGVGKTSSVRDIGYTLVTLGYRVLLIDADPQANLTEWLGVQEDISLEQTIYGAVIAERQKVAEIALPKALSVHGLDLIPSNLELAKLDAQLVTEFNGFIRLRKAVARLEGYDFVLIDPPPSLGQLSALSVIAADYVIVPLPTNSKGLRGISTVQAMIERYSELNPQLQLGLFLLTQYDSRTRHDRQAVEAVRAQLSDVAPVTTPLSARPAIYKDAQIMGQPIPVYRPNSPVTDEIHQVTRELLTALNLGKVVQRGK